LERHRQRLLQHKFWPVMSITIMCIMMIKGWGFFMASWNNESKLPKNDKLIFVQSPHC
jgi:uncharacterized phage infection (PIP) family protein YhgE